MPDVMAPEAHQNNRSYVRELSGLSIQDAKIYHTWWAATWSTYKTSPGVGACPGQYTVI